MYYFFHCSQQHRCLWRGYIIENVSKSKKIPLNIDYPLPITSQPPKLDIIILCIPTTRYFNGSSVVRMSSSSSGFILSINCAPSITVIWSTEQRSSGCATSFVAFYHHQWPPRCLRIFPATFQCTHKGTYFIISILSHLSRTFLPLHRPPTSITPTHHPQVFAYALKWVTAMSVPPNDDGYNTPQLTVTLMPAHGLPWPWIQSPAPSWSTQHLLHWDRGQSLWHDEFSVLNNLKCTEKSDINHHLCMREQEWPKINDDGDDEQDGGNNDNGGGDNFTLMECHGNAWGRTDEERQHRGTTLEGGRHQAGGCNEDWDTNS